MKNNPPSSDSPNNLVGDTKMQRPALPDFFEPPVVEVSLSLQFEPLRNLQTPHLGIFWSDIRHQFPFAEEQPPIPPAVEVLGPPPHAESSMRVEVLRIPPVNRCWFMNAGRSELLQVQRDRFIANWRKHSQQDQYPRYERVRDIFLTGLQRFQEFVKREELGTIVPNQCEVTYVNRIVAGKGWEKAGELGNVVTVWSQQYSDEFLSQPEDVRFNIKYSMVNDDGQQVGRLHISLEPKLSAEDNTLIFIMVLTARGKPEGEGIEGALRFFDRGRKYIVRGFTSITTPRMHEIWRRRDRR